jgi:hypothetical protein
MYIMTLNAKISRKLHEIFTKISVKDPDPKRFEGRIWIRIRNDPPGRIGIPIQIRNNSFGSATLGICFKFVLEYFVCHLKLEVS